MMCFRHSVAALFALSLTACASPQLTIEAVSEKQLVEVPYVIGSLKCAFWLALETEEGFRRLDGNVASVTLGLKLVDTTEVKGNADLSGPAILTLGSGGTVAPFFSGGVKATNTVESIIKFRLRLTREPEHRSACASTPNDVRNRFAFESWLSKVIASLEPNAAFAPAGELDSIQFKGNFGVTHSGGAGGQFKLVFLSGKAEATASRDDVQLIDFTIQRPSQQAQLPKNKVGDGGATTLGVPIPNPNFQ